MARSHLGQGLSEGTKRRWEVLCFGLGVFSFLPSTGFIWLQGKSCPWYSLRVQEKVAWVASGPFLSPAVGAALLCPSS